MKKDKKLALEQFKTLSHKTKKNLRITKKNFEKDFIEQLKIIRKKRK